MKIRMKYRRQRRLVFRRCHSTILVGGKEVVCGNPVFKNGKCKEHQNEFERSTKVVGIHTDTDS